MPSSGIARERYPKALGGEYIPKRTGPQIESGETTPLAWRLGGVSGFGEDRWRKREYRGVELEGLLTWGF
jgi:hypothetical protein